MYKSNIGKIRKKCYFRSQVYFGPVGIGKDLDESFLSYDCWEFVGIRFTWENDFGNLLVNWK